jgi:hypothetical protein
MINRLCCCTSTLIFPRQQPTDVKVDSFNIVTYTKYVKYDTRWTVYSAEFYLLGYKAV